MLAVLSDRLTCLKLEYSRCPKSYGHLYLERLRILSIIIRGGLAHSVFEPCRASVYMIESERLEPLIKKQIQGSSKGKVDLADWYFWNTFDVIGDLALGESFNCLHDTSHIPWLAILSYLNFKFVVFLECHVTLSPSLQRLLRLVVSNKALQARTVYARKFAKEVERRMKTVRPQGLTSFLHIQ